MGGWAGPKDGCDIFLTCAEMMHTYLIKVCGVPSEYIQCYLESVRQFGSDWSKFGIS